MTNAGLFAKVVETFLSELSEEDWEEAGDITFDSENSTPRLFESDVEEEPKEEEGDYITGGTKHSSKHPYPKYLPKFHIKSGSQVGRVTFRKAFRQIRIIYDLYGDKRSLASFRTKISLNSKGQR
jgi:hypothetical protein